MALRFFPARPRPTSEDAAQSRDGAVPPRQPRPARFAAIARRLRRLLAPRRWVPPVAGPLTGDGASTSASTFLPVLEAACPTAPVSSPAGAWTSQVLEHMSDAFFTVDRRWRFTYLNAQAERLLFLERAAALGEPLWDLVSEAVGSIVHDPCHRAMDEQRVLSFEAFYPPHDRWYEVTACPSADGLAICFREGTEHRAAQERGGTQDQALQEALRSSEAQNRRLAHVAAHTINGVVIADAMGRIEWINEGFTRITGYTLDEVRGRTPGTVLQGPLSDSATVTYMRARLRQHRGFKTEIVNYHKTGKPYWVEVDVQPIRETDGTVSGFIGLQTDITERVERDRALRESEERWRQLVEHNPGAILVVEDLEILYANPAAAALVRAVHPEHIIGRTLIEFVDPAQHERLLQQLQTLPQPGERTALDDYAIRCLDGTATDVEAFALAVTYRDRPAHQIVWQDVTVRKQAERSLRQAKERAEEITRMKSVLLENMSHEIRTPLASIITVAEILQEETDGEHRELAAFIEQGGHRLLETLDAVLTLSQLESGTLALRRTSCDVAAVADGLVRQYMPQAAAQGLALVLDAPAAGSAVAHTDPTALQQLLSILLNNAIKFTEAGHVTVTVRGGDDYLTVAVRDTGIGIPAAFLPHLFEEFQQASSGLARTYEGSGLGLAIARRLADLMGAAIEVDTAEGAGSCFSVHLSLAPSASCDAPIDASEELRTCRPR